MRFALIDQAKNEFPVGRLCKVFGVIQSGYFAYRSRSASKRQKGDMVMITQSFNTTNSMGRLTLNMLLSFA
jgi:hypothetical protein